MNSDLSFTRVFHDHLGDGHEAHQLSAFPQNKKETFAFKAKCAFYFILAILLITIIIYSAYQGSQGHSQIGKMHALAQTIKEEILYEMKRQHNQAKGSHDINEQISEIQQRITKKFQSEITKLKRQVEQQFSMAQEKANRHDIIIKKMEQLIIKNEQIEKQKIRERTPLYSDAEQLQKEGYEKELMDLLKRRDGEFEGLLLPHKYSMRLNDTEEDPQPHLHVGPVTESYSINEDLPICLIVPSYSNAPLTALEQTLNSIFRQKYTNYLAVIFPSQEARFNTLVETYLRRNSINTSNYILVKNIQKTTPIENMYNAVHNYCQPQAIGIVLEGGNTLYGKEVFRSFNEQHHVGTYVITVTNHFKINPKQNYVDWGWTSLPSKQEIRELNYRDKIFYQLFSFRTEVFKEIDVASFKDLNGSFYEGYVFAMMVPLFELSCGSSRLFSGIHSIEYRDSRYGQRFDKQHAVYDMIKARKTPPYSCSKYIEAAWEKGRHNHPVLDYISEPRKQKGGMIATPPGDIRAIDPYHINSQGQTYLSGHCRIVDVLYPSKQTQMLRAMLHEKRIAYVSDKTKFRGINLIKFSLDTYGKLKDQQAYEQQQQYDRMSQAHQFQSYKQQLPICLISCSFNNNIDFRIQLSLNSIFRQNYTNYFAVLINDRSNDYSDTVFRKYLDFYQVPKDKYVYIQNHARLTTMENIYNAAFNSCSEDSVAVILDGDDELIGRNVFKLFNAKYQKSRAGYIYTNFYQYNLDRPLDYGFCKDYTLEQKENIKFRTAAVKNSHTRSFKTALFRKVDKSNFQDQKGEFYKMTADLATALAVMEKACGRVYFVNEVNYLYNYITGNNDVRVDSALQESIARELKGKKQETCDHQYALVPLLQFI